MCKFFHLLFALAMFIICLSCSSQDEDVVDNNAPASELYFPPINTTEWETISLASLGWNERALQPLYDFLEERGSQAFIILKDGKIAVEAYFNGGSISQRYPWFSAGKTLSAFAMGIAQQEGFLSLNDASADYLGNGWSSLTAEQEKEIKIWHHLTMTTGVNYNVADTNCTSPECLTFLNMPGSFWFYHNATYTLTQQIIQNATDQDFASYYNSKIRNPIGMDGVWISSNFNSIYVSTARSMARFGLLNLNKGNWDRIKILKDTQYFEEMTTTSQSLNKAYGYLWWINGAVDYRVPGSTLLFQGDLIPTAPKDLIAGLGANDQKLYVVPSQKLVIVRLGDDGGETLLGPSGFDTLLWEKINDLIN
ncbi:serine hydrolase domain-containing protein [Flavobacteriaceae bacterium M23B6Z8]